jgi:cell division protein FtsZ
MGGKMRVSVVATGIDAVAKTSDIPVPRRPMAAPLTQQVTAEAPIETPAPAPEPVEEIAASVEVDAAPEPSLFDDTAPAEPTFDAPAAVAAAESDLPPAAYQPRPELEIEAPTDAYIAPQRPAVGTPSQETLDRLRTAASRSATPAAAPMESEEAAKPRMGGLNSLISRMTGQPDGAAKERPQPPVATLREEASPAPEADADQERIEIPAFLRRQAN